MPQAIEKGVEILSRGEFVKGAGFQMRGFTPGFYVPFARRPQQSSSAPHWESGNRAAPQGCCRAQTVDDIEHAAMQTTTTFCPGWAAAISLSLAGHTLKHGDQAFAIFKM
jgi:hypothetical protein